MSAGSGETGEARTGLHPVMRAIRGQDGPSSGGRLSIQHLEQRDRALAAITRAREEVERLEDVEVGTIATPNSPRIRAVREVKGELGKLANVLDRTYV